MFNVSLRCFEAFLAIVDRGSFVSAANHMGISQPSISAHIASLEKQVGGKVFLRGRGMKPTLTELGHTIVDHARELVAEFGELRADLSISRAGADQKVLFACQRSIANFVLHKSITEFAVNNPDIHLIVNMRTQEQVLKDVRDGTADIGCLLTNGEIRGMETQVIGRERLLIVASPDNPLARRKKVSPKEVREHGFVMPPPSSLFGRAIIKLLSEAGIGPVQIVAQATEHQFQRELVNAGLGIACSPAVKVAGDVATGVLAVVDVDAPPLYLDIRTVTSTKRAPENATQEFSNFLAQTVNAYAA